MMDERARMSQYEAEGELDDIFDDGIRILGFWARLWSGLLRIFANIWRTRHCGLGPATCGPIAF
jgi:hypothetical protein